MMDSPRILFSTIPVNILKNSNSLKNKIFDTTSSYQSWTAMNKEIFQFKVSNPAFGLHFIKENIKGVDILEYPTWDEYSTALKKGYDIVGINFFTWTFPDMIKMAEMARENNVKEVWGGNYGVMTPGADQYLDKIFYGYCEAAIYKELKGETLTKVSHPAMIGEASIGKFNRKEKIGFLYTKRGCKSKCSFCPTPWFTDGNDQCEITGITQALDTYQRLNASPVIIYDETFLDNKKTSEMVIEELARRNLQWVCLTRADRIVGNVSRLKKKGLQSVIIGVESLRDENLSFVSKKEKSALIKEVIDELTKNNCFADGTYMLGFPNDTVESMKEDINTLSSWGFFLMQFTILTPFPGTPLYEKLKDKIISRDWNHFDSYHLVWDHPHLTPAQARETLFYALKKINRPYNYLRKIIPYIIKNRTTDYIKN